MSDGAELQPGTLVAGKYRIERVLGRGGMGVVLEARHLELDQRVAMKLLLPEAMRNAEAVERFVREGRASAKLSSPHVAKVFDVGRLDTGQPFLVMEFLRGRDLKALVEERGPQALPDVVRWVREAAEALTEAHALGVVHRDIKPANLFLAELPTGRTTIKVVDFGISKQIDPGSVDLTRTSSMMGSPLYMAPEQVMSSKHVDPRVDIWALGVVLYEMTTGRPPFSGSALTEVIGQIMTREPALPSAVRADLPAAFDEVVMTCLRKDPQQRYPTMAALDEALRAMTHAVAPGPAQLASDPSAQLPSIATDRTAMGYPPAPAPGRASSAEITGPPAPRALPPHQDENAHHHAFHPSLPGPGAFPAGQAPALAASTSSANVTQQGWGATGGALPAASSRTPMLIAGSIGGLALVLGIASVALRGGPTEASTTISASPDAAAPAPDAAPAVTPTDAIPSAPTADASGATVAPAAPPSASSSAGDAAAPAPSVAPPAAARPVSPARPAARPPPRPERTSSPSLPPATPPPAATPKKPSMY